MDDNGCAKEPIDNSYNIGSFAHLLSRWDNNRMMRGGSPRRATYAQIFKGEEAFRREKIGFSTWRDKGDDLTLAQPEIAG
jgi:hypothetical protein